MSPDGRWIAYVSDATERAEIWLKSVAGSSAPIRISPDGGTEPVWARNGRDLFYVGPTGLMAVRVNLQDTSRYERPVRLFEGTLFAKSEQPPSYDVAADGRFLMTTEDGPKSSISVVLNWTAKIRSAPLH